jgi:hypothetical protein
MPSTNIDDAPSAGDAGRLPAQHVPLDGDLFVGAESEAGVSDKERGMTMSGNQHKDE